jgi:hypothetical protein
MPVIRLHRASQISLNPVDGYFLTTTNFDGDGSPFLVELNPNDITTAGRYAVVRSENPLSNVGNPVAIVAFQPSSQALEVRSISQETLLFSGSIYHCIVATVVPKTNPTIPSIITDSFILTDSYDGDNYPSVISINPNLVMAPGKYVVVGSSSPMQNIYSPPASIIFDPPTQTRTINYVGRETNLIGSILYDCIVMVVT